MKSSACSGRDPLVPGICGKVSVRLAGFSVFTQGGKPTKESFHRARERTMIWTPLGLAPMPNPSVLCRTPKSLFNPPTLCSHHTLGQPSEVQYWGVALGVCISWSTFSSSFNCETMICTSLLSEESPLAQKSC